MQPAAPMLSPAVHEEWMKRRQRLLVFVVLAGLYLTGHVLFRWLLTLLFDVENWTGIGEYFGPKSGSWVATLYQIHMALLPVALWGAFVFIGLARHRHLTHCSIAFLVIAWGLAFVEADMQWFRMSRQHITWADMVGFFRLDGANDIGLTSGDYRRFYTMLLIHGAALAACIPAAWFLCRLGVHRWLAWLDKRRVVTVLIGLMLLDVVIVRHNDDELDAEDVSTPWGDLARANPLRLRFLDDWYKSVTDRFSEKYHDLRAANAGLRELKTDGAVPTGHGEHVRLPTQHDGNKMNVVVIAIESLNAEVVGETELPFLKEFSKKCLRLKRHFAAGNGTHYGLLGLFYGTPISFYRGPLAEPRSNPYLDLFDAKGCASRSISTRLFGDGGADAGYHYLGHYFTNWTRPERITDCVCETPDDWSIVPEFHKEMAKPGPRFTFLFYLYTHFRYWHRPEFNAYQPEVEEDFNFNRSDLMSYRDRIVNRYKNSVLEMDAWLGECLSKVDLSRTIVVITGDHGEELLERGRIGHCMTLNTYQTQVPCLVYVPGMEGRDVDFVTCHTDLLPSVVDALGWKENPAGLGQSIFHPVPCRYAIVAQQNWLERPVRWMIVSADRKTIVDETSKDRLEVTRLLDLQGRWLRYRDQPERWRENFSIIRKMEAELKR